MADKTLVAVFSASGTTKRVGEEIAREIIKRGLELGVNFYDTAIAYQSGNSEQILFTAI